MGKLRSISTTIWSDTWFEELSPNDKLLFIYLITNEKTNMLGIYEVSIKKICFETGLKSDTVRKALEGFERIGKVRYEGNFIILVNFLKHQKFNTNMKVSAININEELPNDIKAKGLGLTKETLSKDWLTLLNHYGMVRKIEDEVEVEDEEEDKKIQPYKTFYKEQLELATEHKKEYQMFIDILYGKNDLGVKLDNVLKLEQQVEHQQFLKLLRLKNEHGKSIGELLLKMQNDPKHLKGKVSLYMTLRNWIKNPF